MARAVFLRAEYETFLLKHCGVDALGAQLFFGLLEEYRRTGKAVVNLYEFAVDSDTSFVHVREQFDRLYMLGLIDRRLDNRAASESQRYVVAAYPACSTRVFEVLRNERIETESADPPESPTIPY